MSGFIILFEEKEGTSPLVRLLDNVEGVSVVHREGGVGCGGWEPFDSHCSGPMSASDLEGCLGAVFSPSGNAMETANPRYLPTGKKPLIFDLSAPIRGFKMRFRPPGPYPAWTRAAAAVKPLRRGLISLQQAQFKRMTFRIFLKQRVTAFVAVRRDALRWALSKYHGDGTGQRGHVQFELAAGKLKREDIGKIAVDLKKLKDILSKRHRSYDVKQALLQELQASGINAFPIFYEDFLADKVAYLRDFFGKLGSPVSDERIASALSKDMALQKVHSDDISTFVMNHEEVVARFGDLASAW